jgi:acetoacetyl-CoA synthetase
VAPGQRVAGFLPNLPETMMAMLATASVGAVWSSCSPDFGVQGVLDRFGQIEPTVLFVADGYVYNGKRHDRREVAAQLHRRLSRVAELVVVPYLDAEPDISSLPGARTWAEFTADFVGVTEPEFLRLPFDHPLFIMYSSGTTGLPKCMVHSAGGTLLQHLKEHQLHGDLRRGDRLFYFTTCGWMMWNWLASGLASEATLLLFDGAPLHPDTALWDLASRESCTHFGTSARFLAACEKAGLVPGRSHDLGALRAVMSTGSPLAPESFDWVYRAVKPDLQLSSISGGTDIISCFALGSPVLPVRRGELQCRGLGMAVEVWNERGQSVVGEKGELVCTRSFPSMPTGFWNDPDGAKYRAAYFARYPGVWHHGDYAELRSEGGMAIYGRSDAVLNPGGVRIGTAEIYRVVEQFDEVLESVVVGQRWGDDLRVVLFVMLREGVTLDDALRQRIRRRIRAEETPRHVPAKIVAVADIPRTISGKITELAVRKIIHGEPVENRDALANPAALDLFADLPELREN